MLVNDLKTKLHQLIDSTDNELVLGSLLQNTEKRLQGYAPDELEGLSVIDYNDLLSVVEEEPEKDTITYDELKSSLGRWFGKEGVTTNTKLTVNNFVGTLSSADAEDLRTHVEQSRSEWSSSVAK